ncbi:MAG: hypothetical protein CMJ83_15720 [Planctomycetes bacterium]|nr:hypothetical protein [Planctomycetota bacterium]
MEVTPDVSIDCKNMLCPMPVVKTRKAIKGMEIGQILQMIATDPGVVPDMSAWEKQTRHEIVYQDEIEGGVFRFQIKKTH